MKSKQEILNNYYTEGADGMPEITADGLLKAMDEYAEQAFNAARLPNNNQNHYPAFGDLKAEIEKQKIVKNSLSDDLKLIADSILPQFIPTDTSAQSLSFDIRTNGNSYTVHYAKNADGYWEYQNYTE
ncbi:hypothetical protein [Mucilaginibacter sp.]|uniref:hypothetical protein n=1 Tax=Mucilaginibacter sp. TaxID=1882438 RepID=UPI0035BBC911